MVLGTVAGRAATLVVTGLAGAAAYDGLKRLAGTNLVRGAAVAVTAAGLRGARAVEAGAERARLAAADVVSEARERIGEESPPPGGGGHGHTH